MKLFVTVRAPNPRRVQLFLAAKQLDPAAIGLEVVQVDLSTQENRQAAYLQVNPLGQLPALQLDDGTTINDSIAICRYLEVLHPQPPLFGVSAAEQATIEMWSRRTEMILMPPVGAVWVHTHKFTAALPGRNTEWGEANRPRVFDAMHYFDGALAGREFLAGDGYSLADILLLTTLDFAGFVGMAMPGDLTHLLAWHARASARPSASA